MNKDYLPKYRNMSVSAENDFYNHLVEKMEHEHYRWFGTSYITSSEVRKLQIEILTGKTTFAKWRKELADSQIRANMGLGPNDPIPTVISIKSTEQLEKRIRNY